MCIPGAMDANLYGCKLSGVLFFKHTRQTQSFVKAWYERLHDENNRIAAGEELHKVTEYVGDQRVFNAKAQEKMYPIDVSDG